MSGPLRSTHPDAAIHDDRPPRALVESYAAMAHTFEQRPDDGVLRTLDVVLTVCGAVPMAPLVAAVTVALWVRRDGPILYRGQRVGRGGEVFTMLKFRTLRPDAEQRLGPYLGVELTALTAGEMTGLGRVLRATKVDELPQLWNVLRGDMSLVGPRPIRPAFFEQLAAEIPEYWQRLVVRPGLTGPAQLRLTRNMTWSEKLAHDMEWIADRSVVFYMSILGQTVVHLLRRPFSRRARTTVA